MATTFEDVIIRVSERGVKETANSIGILGKESEKAAGAVAALNRIMYTLMGAFSVKVLVDYTDKFQNLSNQLKVVTKDTAELTKVQDQLFQSATKTRTSVAALTDLYVALKMSQKETNISGDKLTKVME